MPVPKHSEFYNSFLEALQDSKSHGIKEIHIYIISKMDTKDDNSHKKIAGGKQSVFTSRVSRCCFYLKKAGLIISPRWATYQITDVGRQLLNSGVFITDEILMKYNNCIALKSDEKEDYSSERVSEETPQDTFDRVFREINDKLADDILNAVINQTPLFFEKLVVQLLKAMGYGGSDSEAGMLTKHSGDEGIDGIIREDKLGFDHIYIQAKRWEMNKRVGRPEIQKFVGALAGKGAGKGLFITTAYFTKGAVNYATQQHTTKIVLVNGKQLARLMIEYNVGVSTISEYTVKRVDIDFFTDKI